MQREAEKCMRAYETGEARLAQYYYEEMLALLKDVRVGNADEEQVCDALVRNAVELAEVYERDEARRMLIRLVDKYLAPD
jgi:hypothetical protein